MPSLYAEYFTMGEQTLFAVEEADLRCLKRIRQLTRSSLSAHIDTAVRLFLLAPRPAGTEPPEKPVLTTARLRSETWARVRAHASETCEDVHQVVRAAIEDYVTINKEHVRQRVRDLGVYASPYTR